MRTLPYVRSWGQEAVEADGQCIYLKQRFFHSILLDALSRFRRMVRGATAVPQVAEVYRKVTESSAAAEERGKGEAEASSFAPRGQASRDDRHLTLGDVVRGIVWWCGRSA